MSTVLTFLYSMVVKLILLIGAFISPFVYASSQCDEMLSLEYQACYNDKAGQSLFVSYQASKDDFSLQKQPDIAYKLMSMYRVEPDILGIKNYEFSFYYPYESKNASSMANVFLIKPSAKKVYEKIRNKMQGFVKKTNSKVYVYSGAIIPDSGRVFHDSKGKSVKESIGYFLFWYEMNNAKPKVFAYAIPNRNFVSQDIEKYRTSIARIEKLANHRFKMFGYDELFGLKVKIGNF